MNANPEAPAPAALSAGRTDGLAEVLDAVMGQAAGTISVLLNRRVLLKVPVIEHVTTPGLIAFFEEKLADVGVTIRQRYCGSLNGAAALAFSSENALSFVRALVGIEHELDRLSAADQAVLAEAGNIVLNAAIGVMADRCSSRLRISLPDVSLSRKGKDVALELLGAVAEAHSALVLMNRFSIGDLELTGYVILLMPEGDVKRLLACFDGDKASKDLARR
ncbi:MAG: hypothetical protein AB1558_12585 [Thermodesulfobacteriota bacterium]